MAENSHASENEEDYNGNAEQRHEDAPPSEEQGGGQGSNPHPTQYVTMPKGFIEDLVKQCTSQVEKKLNKGILADRQYRRRRSSQTEKPSYKYSRRPSKRYRYQHQQDETSCEEDRFIQIEKPRSRSSHRPNKRYRYHPQQDETSYEEDEYYERAPDNSDYRSYESSEWDSDSAESSDANNSEDSRKRKKHKGASNDAECFPLKGDTYVMFDKKVHKVIDATKIRWGTEVITVKWLDNSNKKAFCQIKSVHSPITPYMDQTAAHENIANAFDLDTWTGENMCLGRKGFNTELEPHTGLAKVIEFLKSKEGDLIQAILSEASEATIAKTIKVERGEDPFSAPSIAIFTKGWSKAEDYSVWAKGDVLNLDKVAQDLEMDAVTKIPRDVLDEERDARALLVNNFTGLRTLELLGQKLKNEADLATTQAIARLFLPNIKPAFIRWVTAKIKLRSLILQKQKHSAAHVLLTSNVWEPSVFPKEAIERATKRGDRNDIKNVLNLSNRGDLSRGYRYTGYQNKRQNGQWKAHNSNSYYDHKPFRYAKNPRGRIKGRSFPYSREQNNSTSIKQEGNTDFNQGSFKRGKSFRNKRNSRGRKNFESRRNQKKENNTA